MATDLPQRVRVIAKIRASSNPETGSLKGAPNPGISIYRPEDTASRVRISFGDQSTGGKQQGYEVDECYVENAENGVVFEKEIRPLITQVFEGRNATIFAYGARGTGKTFTIQGTEDEPGLAAMAVAEILSSAEEIGRSVSISLYEVHHERVVDLLDPRTPEVSVFEDALGKIRFKGLSEVNVKSMSEFKNLYFGGANAYKPLQNFGNKAYQYRHRGLIVHVLSSPNETLGGLVVRKMNFVDLAGYEYSRKKGSSATNLIEITRINKSLYAILNVVHALNAGEIHVPYRESKLTRMLQGSLGRMSQILMVTCMNPFFCEDSIKALSLVSRSCQASIPANAELARRGKSRTKPLLFSSIKSRKSVTLSTSVKKPVRSLLRVSKEVSNGIMIEAKGRKLYEAENQSKISEQENSVKDVVSEDQPAQKAVIEEENLASGVSVEEQPPQILTAEEPCIPEIEEDRDMPTPITYLTPIAADFPFRDKENKSLVLDSGVSPPLSARLKELSNNLKSLCTATKLKFPTTQEDDSSTNYNEVTSEMLEPVTPSIQRRPIDLSSPEDFHTCNSRLKDSFVKAHLKFLNTASKEELKQLKGIGEKRASYILKLRNQSPEPFNNLQDLENIGLSAKQIKGMMRKAAEGLF